MPPEIATNHRARTANPREAVDKDRVRGGHGTANHIEDAAQRPDCWNSPVRNGDPQKRGVNPPAARHGAQKTMIAFHLLIFGQVNKGPDASIQERRQPRDGAGLVVFGRMFTGQELAGNDSGRALDTTR